MNRRLAFSQESVRVLVIVAVGLLLRAGFAATPDESRNSVSLSGGHALFSGDDVNRMERPGGKRDWSAAAAKSVELNWGEFESRWQTLKPEEWPIPRQVDYRLMGSALARILAAVQLSPFKILSGPGRGIVQTLFPGF